jgi:hypothetical protein
MKKLVLISLVCAFAVIGLWLAGSGVARTPVANAQAAATPTPVPFKVVGIAPDRLPPTGGELDLSGAVFSIGVGVVLIGVGLALHRRRMQAG